MNQLHERAKQRLLPWYYYGTWIFRKFGMQFARTLSYCPITVLYYHRVADHCQNPWTISNREFRRQIDWLGRRFEFVSLDEAQRRLAGRNSPRPAVCVTFDDGYAENCHQALPLLIERKIPVTYFVATEFVLEDKPFPHDVERGEPLPANTVSQLRDLAQCGIDIGAHTRTHMDLGPITDDDALLREIVGSREDLQQALGQAVRYFAFPYGQHANLSAQAVRVIRDAGFSGFCSAYGGYNFPCRDAYHLQRIHGDPNWPIFKNWMTLDPRNAWFLRSWNERSPQSKRRDVSAADWSQLSVRVDAFRRATAADGNIR